MTTVLKIFSTLATKPHLASRSFETITALGSEISENSQEIWRLVWRGFFFLPSTNTFTWHANELKVVHRILNPFVNMWERYLMRKLYVLLCFMQYTLAHFLMCKQFIDNAQRYPKEYHTIISTAYNYWFFLKKLSWYLPEKLKVLMHSVCLLKLL